MNSIYGSYGVSPMQGVQMQPMQQMGYFPYQANAQGMFNFSNGFTSGAPAYGMSMDVFGGTAGAGANYGGSFGIPSPAQIMADISRNGMYPDPMNPGGGAGPMFGGSGTNNAFGFPGLGMPSMDQIQQMAARDLGINPATVPPPGQFPSMDQIAQMAQSRTSQFMPSMEQIAQMAANQQKAFADAMEKANPGAAAEAQRQAEEQQRQAQAQQDAFLQKLADAIAKGIKAGQTPAPATTTAAAPATTTA